MAALRRFSCYQREAGPRIDYLWRCVDRPGALLFLAADSGPGPACCLQRRLLSVDAIALQCPTISSPVLMSLPEGETSIPPCANDDYPVHFHRGKKKKYNIKISPRSLLFLLHFMVGFVPAVMMNMLTRSKMATGHKGYTLDSQASTVAHAAFLKCFFVFSMQECNCF